MRSVALSLALTMTPMAARAQEANAYTAAVEARRQGNPAEAKRLLEQWLVNNPGDVDARLQLGYAELALGNRAAARASFEAVLEAAPQYADAREGLRLVTARDPQPSPGGAGQVLVEGALSDLSGPADNWREIAVDVNAPAGNAVTLGGRAAHYRRFGLNDVEVVGRIDWRASDRLALRAQVGGTPDADFRPELSLGGGADLRLAADGTTVLTFDARSDRFPLQTVITLSPGIVQYVAQGRGWITVRGIGTVADGGALQVGGLLRGDYVPADNWRLYAGFANGPDTDLGIVTRTTSVFGGIEMPLFPNVGIIGSIGRDWRDGGPDRTDFRVGVKVAI